MAVIGSLAGRHFWNVRIARQLQSLIDKARNEVGQKDWENAAISIRAAAKIRAEEPALMRVMVDYLDATGTEPVVELQMLRTLKEKGLAQPGDMILSAHAHVRRGDLAAARALWEKLSAEEQAGPAALELKAHILSQEGGAQEARELQKRAALQGGDTPEAALKIAILDTESAYAEVAGSGLDRVWEISRRADSAGLKAIRHLSTHTGLTLTQAQELQERVRRHPASALADHLAVSSALIRLAPEQRSAVIDDLVQRYQDEGLDTTVALARWLAAEKEHERLSKLVSQDMMLKSKELFPILLQSWAESGQWQQMSKVLTRPQKLPMSVEGLSVWRALASSRLQPDLKQAEQDLKLAIKQAVPVRSWGPLRAAAQVAEDLQLWNVAIEGYWQLALPETGNEMEMLEKCWQIATHMGDSSRLLDTARKQSSLRPTSLQFSSRLDYLRLLRGEEIESITGGPAQDKERPREHDSTVLLAALKAYRLGDPALTKEALAQITDASALSAGQRAVYAGLLASAGDRGRAYQMAERIPAQLLIPEEKVFLSKAL